MSSYSSSFVNTESLAPKFPGGEPLDHYEAVIRIKRLLESLNFRCSKDAYSGKYKIANKGIREYWPDLLVEHQTVEHYKFIIEVDGGYHFSDYRVKHNEIENHDADLYFIYVVRKGYDRLKIYHFSVEEIIGTREKIGGPVTGHMVNIKPQPDEWILEKLCIQSAGSGGGGQYTQ